LKENPQVNWGLEKTARSNKEDEIDLWSGQGSHRPEALGKCSGQIGKSHEDLVFRKKKITARSCAAHEKKKGELPNLEGGNEDGQFYATQGKKRTSSGGICDQTKWELGI